MPVSIHVMARSSTIRGYALRFSRAIPVVQLVLSGCAAACRDTFFWQPPGLSHHPCPISFPSRCDTRFEIPDILGRAQRCHNQLPAISAIARNQRQPSAEATFYAADPSWELPSRSGAAGWVLTKGHLANPCRLWLYGVYLSAARAANLP